jgi:hypothetical protein
MLESRFTGTSNGLDILESAYAAARMSGFGVTRGSHWWRRPAATSQFSPIHVAFVADRMPLGEDEQVSEVGNAGDGVKWRLMDLHCCAALDQNMPFQSCFRYVGSRRKLPVKLLGAAGRQCALMSIDQPFGQTDIPSLFAQTIKGY